MPIRVPHGTAERLGELEQGFEIVWATAWFDGANKILPVLGIESSWPVLEWRDLKLDEMPGFAAGRRFAWVDDDVDFELRNLNERGTPWELEASEALLLEIDPLIGLADADVETLLAFAAA
jgi:hypothetical protein